VIPRQHSQKAQQYRAFCEPLSGYSNLAVESVIREIMPQRRVKPYFEQQAEQEARDEQTRLTRRNEALGLVLIAAAILVWWLFHTNPKWIFPPNWWRP
jgi:hypothetical protein